jgi:antitoxin ParD1/3/4
MATLNISLTDEMRAYVEERVGSGRYGNASEYFRDLIRGDQDRQRDQDLERLLLEGLRSGDAKPLTRAELDRARAFVRELATKKKTKSK